MKSTNFDITQKSQIIDKDNISNINQQNEQDLINYNQINSSQEKSYSSTKMLEKNKIEIEQKNIQMLIFQRSLYIMKQRFAQNRKETQMVYDKYKNAQYKSLECISTQNLLECFKDVFQINQINLYPYENFNDLATADLVSGSNEEKYNKLIKELAQFTKKNVVKYNEKFYENKMKKKKLKEEEERKNLKELEKYDVSDKVKIVHKDKRGGIISDFKKISESNKKVVIDELIYSFTEEDMMILTSNNLLYHGVIPLIIADFIQEYMEKNIKIGIIMTNRNFYHEKEDLLLEQNIKVLYDNEIMKLYINLNKIDPTEEKNEDLKKLLFESNSIDNKIQLYNKLILENSQKGEDIMHFVEIIKKLKDQKALYQKKISEINNKKISLNYNKSTSNSQNKSKTINTNTKISKINSSSLRSRKIDSKVNQSLNNSKNNSKVHIKIKSKKLTKEEIRQNTLSFDEKKGRLMKDRITIIFKQDIKDATLMTFEEFDKCLKKMAYLMHKEKKWYKSDQLKFYELKRKELIKNEKTKKSKKGKNINEEKNKNEEEKNIEQNIDKMVMTNGEDNEDKEENNENNNNSINENDNNNEINSDIKEEGKKEDDKKSSKEKKSEKQSDKKSEKQSDKKSEKQLDKKSEKQSDKKSEKQSDKKSEKNSEFAKEKRRSKASSIKEQKIQKEPENNLMKETKEVLDEKIFQLKEEIKILEQKTEMEIVEDFYTYLELDDPVKCQKKSKGYVRPFLVREDDTRNPEKNVKNPVKFNNKLIMKKYEYLIQRRDEIKKQKEMQNIKEKEIKFEERKKKFNKKLKKLERSYDTKIKKDNYIQIKKSEDDYLKGKNNKLTWNYIQKNDYKAFLLNDEEEININSIPSQLKDIFVDKKEFNNLGEDEDFINNIYSNDSQRLKNSFNKSKQSNNENSGYLKNESFSKFSDLSID